MKKQTSDATFDTRRKILRAAARVINSGGVLALTLEAVAKEAAISKGGLLYHFPSKDALLDGMNNYLMQGFMSEVASTAGNDPCEKGKWARAYTQVTFNQLDSEYDMNVAFLSAAATNPKLLETMAKDMRILQTRIDNDQLDPAVATVIRLAVDGMYFNQLYGMKLSDDVREKTLHYLLALTQEES